MKVFVELDSSGGYEVIQTHPIAPERYSEVQESKCIKKMIYLFKQIRFLSIIKFHPYSICRHLAFQN